MSYTSEKREMRKYHLISRIGDLVRDNLTGNIYKVWETSASNVSVIRDIIDKLYLQRIKAIDESSWIHTVSYPLPEGFEIINKNNIHGLLEL